MKCVSPVQTSDTSSFHNILTLKAASSTTGPDLNSLKREPSRILNKGVVMVYQSKWWCGKFCDWLMVPVCTDTKLQGQNFARRSEVNHILFSWILFTFCKNNWEAKTSVNWSVNCHPVITTFTQYYIILYTPKIHWEFPSRSIDQFLSFCHSTRPGQGGKGEKKPYEVQQGQVQSPTSGEE